jgi:hypothetical protein
LHHPNLHFPSLTTSLLSPTDLHGHEKGNLLEPFHVHVFNPKKMEREEFAQFLGKVITLINVMNRNKMPKEKIYSMISHSK